jgi:hypothetical protein
MERWGFASRFTIRFSDAFLDTQVLIVASTDENNRSAGFANSPEWRYGCCGHWRLVDTPRRSSFEFLGGRSAC